MKKRISICFFLILLPYCVKPLGPVYAGSKASVETFSPQGIIKNVRQVTVRFSEQMVPIGDPRVMEPFEIRCPEKGRGRWADGKNWIYDFDKDLPAGSVCDFTLKPDLKTLSGRALTGRRRFFFSTGGPAVRTSYPHEGTESIEEDQIFILTLDAEPTGDSVVANVSFAVQGVHERIGVKILKGEEREKILKLRRYRANKDLPEIVIQCRQKFPTKSVVKLIWGKGVASTGGVQTTEDQILSFKTRGAFTATFSCERENARAECIPLLPMQLRFSSAVSWNIAKRIILKGDRKIYRAEKSAHEDGEEAAEEDSGQESGLQDDQEYLYSISFRGPFPQHETFSLEIPEEVRDDAGRELSNRNRFPIVVRTDSYPPLAKFSSRFGIIELKGDATLPVTVRNIERAIKTRVVEAEKATPEEKVVEGLRGGLRRIPLEQEEDIIKWLSRVASAKREHSILKNDNEKKEFSLPKPGGSKAFEVIGIPLQKPGLYIVELESRLLGTTLLGASKPMYVPTAALVTNLSAHLKWGRESSLVWVTTLDKAEPVMGASVSIRDCKGTLIWNGKTDQNGIANIGEQLPSDEALPHCETSLNYAESSPSLNTINSGLFVFARTSDDMTFILSGWDEGIEPWRYNLPAAYGQKPVMAHTVLDRSLLRAGETVHMKHIIRKHTMSGYSMLEKTKLPQIVSIKHLESEQSYEQPLKWDENGTAETEWKIPAGAKLGYYDVVLSGNSGGKNKTGSDKPAEGDLASDFSSGMFRVEEFRVPLMKGVIQPLNQPLINANQADVDLFVSYLSGGGAVNAPVKLRSELDPKFIGFDDYEDFTFASGRVKEGIERRSDYEEQEEPQKKKQLKLPTMDLKLDKSGTARITIPNLPQVSRPEEILTELEFRDPDGAIETTSKKIPVWPAKILLGIKPESWVSSKEDFKFQTVALDLSGRPVPNVDVKVELFQRKYYSHRKRLVGGFYSYDHITETKGRGPICEGKTDAKGLLICEGKSPISGNAILQARAKDDAGNPAWANVDVWIAGGGEWWFDVGNSDRIDLLPERKKYEPGETAKFQVRMPFRHATALITVEREGIISSFVKRLSGKEPVIEIPVSENYAPNVFVSALVVRGRADGIQPTAMVDLGKPAFKLGIAEINVGRSGHELKVKVLADKEVYRIREKARVLIQVSPTGKGSLPKGSEVAVAAVDEGLLELMPNKSWDLLDAMMGRRAYEVKTSTAQMQVVGKRHYGLKAVPHGGGGGKQMTRELFDTLLFWKAHVPLNEKGEAAVEIPLNDSLTAFRIVVVADGGAGLFGTGHTDIRTAQDLTIFSGIPPVVREGDKFMAGFTLRNSSERKMEVGIKANVRYPEAKGLNPLMEILDPGEAKEIGWIVDVPYGKRWADYYVSAEEKNGGARDEMKIRQKIADAVPLRTFQAAVMLVEKQIGIDIERPKDALEQRGGITVSLKPKISEGLGGVRTYMEQYPYTCMEQKASRAVALRDVDLWKSVVAELPSYLDPDGLLKYFPSCAQGSDVLTAYFLSISHEAGWDLPLAVREQMEAGLKGFIEGRVIRFSALPTADLSIRKVAAIEALSRRGNADVKLLDSITIEPNLWPTSAVIDWTNVLLRMKGISGRMQRLSEAEQILRARLNFQGTTMGFSTERTDFLWWLMTSADVNAVRTLLTFSEFDSWKEDMPRLARGALSRQRKGAWDTTTANAWGILAFEKFSNKYETVPVTGQTTATLGEKTATVDWQDNSNGRLEFGWPPKKETLTIAHQGAGKPWATIQSVAAIPLKESFSSGYKIRKKIMPIEQKNPGKWSPGDIARVALEVESQSDMTWVVVNDPVPAGSNILGTGLGPDSQILTGGEESKGLFPAFEERSFEAFRAYYEFVPKGKWTVEYTLRLNNSGVFHLPQTRVEALYAPEMFGEIPNGKWEVGF